MLEQTLANTFEVPRRGGPVSENHQLFNFKFALANNREGRYVGTHFFVKCRDFLHDMVLAKTMGKEFICYGMKISPAQLPETFNLLIQIPGSSRVDERIWTTNFARLLAKIEQPYQQPFKLEKLPKPLHYVLMGDMWWLRHPEQIDFITLLARQAGTLMHDGETWGAWNERCCHDGHTNLLVAGAVDKFIAWLLKGWEVDPLTNDEIAAARASLAPTSYGDGSEEFYIHSGRGLSYMSRQYASNLHGSGKIHWADISRMAEVNK